MRAQRIRGPWLCRCRAVACASAMLAGGAARADEARALLDQGIERYAQAMPEEALRALDAAANGTVYVVNGSESTVRVIADGQVSSKDATFVEPAAVALDGRGRVYATGSSWSGDGRLYIADQLNHRVRVVAPGAW
jgi:hypothetical protein